MRARGFGLVVSCQFNPKRKKYRGLVEFIVDGKKSCDFVHGKQEFDTPEGALEDGKHYAELFLKENADQITLQKSFENITQEQVDALIAAEGSVLQ